MSIGWVMFWKAVVVGIWAIIVERWIAYRRKRRERGLPMKKNRKTGVYEVNDWTAHVETTLRWGRDALFAVGFLWWSVLAYFILTDQKDVLAKIVQDLLSA